MSNATPWASGGDAGAPDSVPPVPHPYCYLTLRLTVAEFEQVAGAARAASLTVPEYGREALVAMARSDD